MANEYLKPMLDVGSPRVLNCNVMTRRILAKDPAAQTFFRCKPLNNLVIVFNGIKSRGFFKGQYGLDLGYGNEFAVKNRRPMRKNRLFKVKP